MYGLKCYSVYVCVWGGDILHLPQRRKADCIDDSLFRYCVPKHIIEGKIEERI